MRLATDTVARHLAMLQLIPAHPEAISTSDIRDQLIDIDSEFDVNLRTIQRDLEKLSVYFPLDYRRAGRANHWFWIDKSALIQLPSMGRDTALALRLAEDHLTPLLPPTTLDLLQPYFHRAHEVLGDTNLARWQKKVRVVRSGPPLQKPKIKKAVQDVIYQALLNDQRFEASYEPLHNEPGEYPLNPLGLVSKGGVLYLVATVFEYTDIRQFALHRFTRATLLDEAVKTPKGFNLDHYIDEESEFDYPVSNKPVELKAIINETVAYLLEERPLSHNQVIEDYGDDNYLLQVTVNDTMEIRWWLRSLGSQITIKHPLNFL